MKNNFLSWLITFMLVLLPVACNAAPLKISAFVTAQRVDRSLRDDAGREQALGIFNGIGVTKIYLDTYRDGLITDPQLLTDVRDYFTARGFEVSGGITTTYAPGFGVGSGKYWLCYNYPETRRAIRGVMQSAAKIFDEIIVDDFLATLCKCPECGDLLKGRDWPEFFRDTLFEVSRDDIVGAAKQVNPDITVIIKYPQWYDRFHVYGYDVARQPGIFDMVYVGTETRDPKKEHVMQYEAFANFTWLKSIGGDKTRGAWFDWINCYPEVYMEQAYQSVLAGAEEIVLFGYSVEDFTTDNLKRFAEKRPELVKMADALRGLERRGIIAYKPPNADHGSDTYIFDFMGMFGLPIVMSARFPENARAVFLSEHALGDPDIAAKTLRHIKNGGSVVMTAGFLAGIKDNKELLAAAGYESGKVKRVQQRLSAAFELADGTPVRAAGNVALAALLQPDSADMLAYAIINDKRIPFLTTTKNTSGRVTVINTRTYDVFPEMTSITVEANVLVNNIPEEVIALFRSAAFEPLGIKADVPSKVALYLFGDQAFAIENFNDEEITAKVTIDKTLFGGEVKSLTDILSGETINPGKTTGALNIKIEPRTPRVFQVVK